VSGVDVVIKHIIVLTLQIGVSGDSQDVMISHAHKLRFDLRMMFYF